MSSNKPFANIWKPYSTMPCGRARIILLGDSITQLSFNSNGGFGARLSDIYQRRADVFNRGYSGYNSEWILNMLQTNEGRLGIFGPPNDDGAVGSPPVDAVRLVTIFLGANDASDAELNARQHVPLKEYRTNLEKIVHITREWCPHSKILLITPPPVDHEARLKYQLDRYGDKATGKLERTLSLSGEYATAACETAVQVGVPCLNIWKKMQDADNSPGWHQYLSDGLHLSPKGNQFVGKMLEEFIFEHFPEISVIPCEFTGNFGTSGSRCSNMLQIGPWHDEVKNSRDSEPSNKRIKTSTENS
uniref:SGNH hydrolase-type esterase domain-containing protein n=1 Tax=Corethron hystrix TaxID=216773 RepID=A0A7S1FTJ2_9STRA